MSAVATALLTYSAQLLILVGAAGLAALAVRLALPAARLHYWRGVVVLCLLLPALAGLGPAAPRASVTFEAETAVIAPAAPVAHSWTAAASDGLPWIVLAGIALRLAWLGVGAVRLRQLRRRSRPVQLTPAHAALHADVAPHAVVRATARLAQPVTFGWRRAIVLLPPRFEQLSAGAQQTVLCHELLHVRRGDWPGIVVEELLRAVFWFHPAMWWALDEIHLSREQLVDRLVVARAPARRACYMDALLQFADGPDAARPAIAFLRRRHLSSRLRQLSKEPSMTTRRLLSASLVLLLVVAGTAATVVSALPLALPVLAVQGGTSLEVRLAEATPAPGLVEALVEGSNQRVYLRPGAVVTGSDVTAARVNEAGGLYAINVTFSAAASNRLAEATSSHQGRPLAILLNGRVVAAPTLRSVIRGSAVITGDFTRAEADRIAAALVPPDAAAVPRQAPFDGRDAGVTLPRALTQVKPQYTPAALQAKIQGDVELQLVVRADGSTDSIAVTQSLDSVYGLDDAAVDAAEQWTFTPGTRDGRPVDVLIHLSMRFTLK